ncbi:MAG TPA: hypothetical protein VIY96_01235, partial [Thermoanaerobaculia bacterium]
SSVLNARPVDVPLRNWTVPPYRSASPGGIRTMTDVTSPRVFVGIQPCRVADTRGNGAPITGGIFANSEARDWTVAGICGIPSGADAISVNFSVVSAPATPQGAFLLAWPTGSQPANPVAIMTFGPGTTIISNAAIVPVSAGGQITVNVSHSTHVILDVNGYFSDVLGNPANYLTLTNDSGTWTVNAENLSTTCSGACGIVAVTHSGNALVGQVLETNADPDYGVYGLVSSSNGAGVRGHGFTGGAAGGQFSFGATTTPPDFSASLAVQAGPGTTNYGLLTNAKVFAGSLEISGTKMFVAPHPRDPALEIKYASVEAPTVDVYFRGTGVLVDGYARIEVPDHFRYTAREGTYATTLTPVGRPMSLAVTREGPDGIEVRGAGNARFHYVVYAERAEIEGFEPVQPNDLFTPETLERFDLLRSLPAATRALLVRNGTLNPDGSYNVETARALGWKIPERREESPTTPP